MILASSGFKHNIKIIYQPPTIIFDDPDRDVFLVDRIDQMKTFPIGKSIQIALYDWFINMNHEDIP